MSDDQYEELIVKLNIIRNTLYFVVFVLGMILGRG